jgi:predicted transcriptional regulator of viral defense system
MKSSTRLLNAKKEVIETIIDALDNHIFGTKELRELFQDIIYRVLGDVGVTADHLKSFLIESGYLQEVGFQTPRREVLHIWRAVDNYKLLPKIRPNGYYTHLSALYFHGLLDYEPKNVYFNHEQAARPLSGTNLEQSRIDNAFQKKQRLTTARTIYDGKEYWLLNGKQTGNYGVSLMKISSGIGIPVTNLERTLIDIAVRPAYAGGVNSVLSAYRLAQPNVSIRKLKKALRFLNYVYPYHQSIGFYIDMAGNYTNKAIQEFLTYDTFKYNFYLDYEIKEKSYSEKWRIYYPQDLK